MESLQVLLATYNGSAYLAEQLESILAQTYPEISIFARDDGSQDNTLQILRHYADTASLVWEAGENIGVKRCFHHLLKTCPDADYYAYCDQDDVWESDKIQRAVTQLQDIPRAQPALYFTQTALVDATLQPLNIIQPVISRDTGFRNALVQNVVTGCTLVMNHAARQLLLKVDPDWDKIRMHDWWAYLLVSAYGTIIFDPFLSVGKISSAHAESGRGKRINTRQTFRTFFQE